VIARGAGPFGGNPLGILILILLLFYFFTGGLASPIQNAGRDPVGFLGFVIAIALGITVHEFMHAWTAHRFGDDTGRLMGRLTLDPRAHLDLWGSLLIVLIGFGYGKPVPVNEGRLRPGAIGMSLVALAGPLTNVALAAVAAIPLRFGAADVLGGNYERILLSVVIFNCLLAVFNLIPIPPLDGSKVVYGLLPARQQWSWHAYEQYGPFILLAIIFLLPYMRIDVLGPVVFTPARLLAQFLVGQRVF
jgi:Zn-dependent protease